MTVVETDIVTIE